VLRRSPQASRSYSGQSSGAFQAPQAATILGGNLAATATSCLPMELPLTAEPHVVLDEVDLKAQFCPGQFGAAAILSGTEPLRCFTLEQYKRQIYYNWRHLN
jgi:hypothetical protein